MPSCASRSRERLPLAPSVGAPFSVRTSLVERYDGFMKREIYLDHHATTPVDPRVAEKMRPALFELAANASNPLHAPGRRAAASIEDARGEIARLVDASSRDVIFTSGATEADNLALFGLLRGRGGHVITHNMEHDAVFETLRALEKDGEIELTVLEAGPSALVEPAAIEGALRPNTRLVSIMSVANETGAIQPIQAIGELLVEHDLFFHVDAAQGTGLVPLSMREAHIDLLSLSSHKIYGPMGVGALVANTRARAELRPILFGGGQEGGLRSGSSPHALILGFGEAARLMRLEGAEEAKRLRDLRAVLLDRLTEALAPMARPELLGPALETRHPGNLLLRIPGVHGATLVSALSPDLIASTGASCATGKSERRIGRALGLDEAASKEVLRLGIGRFNTEEEMRRAAERIREAATALRAGQK